MTRRYEPPFSHRTSNYEHPLRSPMRRLRGRISLIALVLLTLVLGFFYRDGTAMVSEGQLHSKHAFLAKDCAACHTPPADGTAMHAGDTLTANCIRCHQDMNAGPHGNLPLVSALFDKKAATVPTPVRQGFIAWANGLPGGRAHPEAHASIACATCHTDHRGQDAKQIRITEATCQACHRSVFNSFADGHPAFAEPTTRPTRQIKFDHVMHYDSGFAKQSKTPVACTACHENPSPTVETPRVKTAEVMCLTCHKTDAAPADALLLSSNSDEPTSFVKLAALVPKIRGIPALGHAPANAKEIAGIVGESGSALVVGITDAMVAKAAKDAELKVDPASIMPGSWAVSNPEGEEHVQLAYRSAGHRDFRIVGWLQWLQANDKAAREKLTGGDLAAWSKAAGEFVLDLGAATAPGAAKASRCALCHFVGNDERTGITADFAKPQRESHFTRPYSHFVHAGQAQHQGSAIDCRSCHVATTATAGKPNDERWKAMHHDRRPQDWVGIPISDCRSCHNASTVRQDCTTCHQYHQANPQ